MSFRYEIIAMTKEGLKLKRFIGNSLEELQERFESWVMRSGYPREDMRIYRGEIQHAGY